MGLMNVNIIKNMKMPSNRRHLCLFILLFSVVIPLYNADDQSESRSDGGADLFGPPVIQFKAKNNNRDLSEISVRKPQQTQHHHHLRHQNSHNSAHRSRSNGAHHKQHNHQSNDSAYNRIPGYPRQAHSPKKHTHYDDDDASEPIGRGGFHMKDHTQQQHQSHRPLTTLGPNRSRAYSRSNSNSWTTGSAEKMSKKNWSDNWSRNRQAPYENTYSSMNRTRTPYNPYMRSHHTARHTTTTTTTTSTSTTTTTAAPDVQEKVFFDAQNHFNSIDSDEMDDDLSYDEYDETFDTKKRSPSIGPFDHDYKTSQQSSENFQRDDPVRSSSGNNGITTSAFKSQPASSGGDNYQLNVNNDGSTNNNNNNHHNPTIETSKSVGDDVKITNLMTRNIQTRSGALTEEKYRALGTAEAVKKTFNSHRNNSELVAQINAHIVRVSQYGSCRPKMTVIPIAHNPMKTYNPHCTVLHRCTDDTGCCHTDYSTCQPRRIQRVTLPFYVMTKGIRRLDIELLPFDNHTECHCVLKSSINEASRMESSPLPNDEPAARVEPTGRFNIGISTTTTTETPIRCSCPNHFMRTSGSQCKCDCPVKQTKTQTIDMCNRLKTGLEHFSIIERRCISSESCERPTCAYGEYDIKAGHCPRKDEAFSSNALNSD